MILKIVAQYGDLITLDVPIGELTIAVTETFTSIVLVGADGTIELARYIENRDVPAKPRSATAEASDSKSE